MDDPPVKVIQKKTNNLALLRTLVTGHRSGSFAAYQLDQSADAAKVAKEIESFIGKDLKPVTVLLLKQ
ncbi:MAG: hypothetical protein O9283_10960 [Sphingomonadaceae bacterium]|nr:hypothetical protein [Sphingomonadaceae bacterium]